MLFQTNLKPLIFLPCLALLSALGAPRALIAQTEKPDTVFNDSIPLVAEGTWDPDDVRRTNTIKLLMPFDVTPPIRLTIRKASGGLIVDRWVELYDVMQLNLGVLPPGVYIIRINDQEQFIYQRRIVVN